MRRFWEKARVWMLCINYILVMAVMGIIIFGATIQKTSSQTKVVYNRPSFTMSFNANGGSCSTSSKAIKFGDAYGDLPTPTRTGYDFTGWYLGDTAVSSETQHKNLNDLALTAHWSAKSYSITSGTNLTGTNISVPSSGTFASAISISSSGSATGYTYSLTNIKIYSGNSTSGTLLATITSTSSTWTMTGNYYSSIYVYATWSRAAKTYTLTFDKQSGSGGTATATATYNSTVPNISVPSRNGYTFGGYYTGSNGSGTQYYNGSGVGQRTWTTDSGATLYAKWTANIITITLNKNGGSGGTDTFYYVYGTNKFYSNAACTTQITSITKPKKKGYTLTNFHGDGTCGGSNGERYVAYDSTNFASDLCTDIYKNATLYATWSTCTTCSGKGYYYETETCTSCGGSGEESYRHKNTCDKYEECSQCGGSGTLSGGNRECTKCSGTGQITCTTCKGKGYYYTTETRDCTWCDGAGETRERYTCDCAP